MASNGKKMKANVTVTPDKVKYKLLVLALITAAKSFTRSEVALAVFDVIEEDVITEWDSIWDKATSKPKILAKLKKIAASGPEEDEACAAFLKCCDELGVETAEGRDEE